MTPSPRENPPSRGAAERPARARRVARPDPDPRAPFLRSLSFALLCLLLTLTFFGWRQRRPRAVEVAWVEPALLELDGLPGWADDRWGDELMARLGALPPFRSDDSAGLARFVDAVSSLSFVEELEVTGIDRLTGALALRMQLAEPVACVPVGEYFQTVSAAGTLLAGLWPSPPLFGRRFLPVIGPLSDADTLFAFAEPGDFLAEEEHLAALAVALSMHAHLSADEAAPLGRVVIDASRAARASVAEPGVRLELEGQRLVLFGRPPTTAEPGELDAAHKWRSIARGAALLAERGRPRDWDLLDARWDRPDLRLVHDELADAADARGLLLARAAGPAPHLAAGPAAGARGGGGGARAFAEATRRPSVR